jgi:hypothetical protein
MKQTLITVLICSSQDQHNQRNMTFLTFRATNSLFSRKTFYKNRKLAKLPHEHSKLNLRIKQAQPSKTQENRKNYII